MDRFSLEIVLTATEGAVHNIGTLICMAWVTADTHNPLHVDTGRAVVSTRPDGGWGDLQAKEFSVPAGQLAELVDSMQALGIPGRKPRVYARSGGPPGWQEINLHISLNGESGQLSFSMQYAGLDGEDAKLCCSMFERLFGLLGVGYLGRWVQPV